MKHIIRVVSFSHQHRVSSAGQSTGRVCTQMVAGSQRAGVLLSVVVLSGMIPVVSTSDVHINTGALSIGATSRSPSIGDPLLLSNLCDPDQLLSHVFVHSFDQGIHIVLCQALGLHRLQNRHRDTARVEDLPLDIQNIAVVCDDHRNDGDLSLDGKVESALLEWEEGGCVCVGASALGEDEDGLLLRVHGLCGLGEGGECGRARGAVDEDGLGEGHELTEEGDPFQTALCGDRGVGWEDAAKHEDIEFTVRCSLATHVRYKGVVIGRDARLVVTDEDTRADFQTTVLVGDVELDTSESPHGPLEGARRGPLAQTAIADEAQDNRSGDTIAGAEDEGAEGSNGAGCKGQDGHVRHGCQQVQCWYRYQN